MTPGWYWMDNTRVPTFVDPRYFHFDRTGKVMYEDPARLDTTKRCLVYTHPGLSERVRRRKQPEKTDFYCKDSRDRDLWAQVLCEVRC